MIYLDNELLIIDEKLAASLFEEYKGFSKLQRLTKEINDTIKGNKSFIQAVGNKDIAENITFSVDVLKETTSEDCYLEVFRLWIPYTKFCIDYTRSVCEYEESNYELFDTGKRIIKIITYEQDRMGGTNAMTLMNGGMSPIPNKEKSLEEICLEALAEFVYREI